MLNFLDKIRNKDNSEKKSFAILCASIVSGLIFLTWLLTVMATWESDFNIKNTSENVKETFNEVKFDEIPGQENKEYAEQSTIGSGVPVEIKWSSTTDN
jgi:hypothetical protein